LVAVLLAVPAIAQPVELEAAFPELPRFRVPIGLETAPGETRLFVVDQVGLLFSFENDEAASRLDTLLDLRSVVSYDEPSWEEGLLGLAFHPDYQENGHFFVYYNAPPANPGEDHRSIVSRFTVTEYAPPRATLGSEVVLLDVEQPFRWHNGGKLAFHPGEDAANLSVSFGDGGSASDPLDHAQNRETLFGSILRLDVDNPSGGRNYGIPPDNPFAGNADGWREELWAYGLRNPWRFSIDPVTGDLWVGDVGQGQWEEVTAVREAGANLGWDMYEGMHCYEGPCDPAGVTFPAWEYPHADGMCSVTGGHVYRGADLPELVGQYVYGDFCTGRVWALDIDPAAGDTTNTLLLAGDDDNEPGEVDLLLSSFGVDAGGELYALGWDTRRVYRFVRRIVDAEPGATGTATVLRAPFPNPFADETVLRFDLAEAGPVRIAVYDVLGREVAVLREGVAAAGAGTVRFSADGLAPGMYVVQLEAAGATRTRKVLLAR
ncbi:MAG: PQQ-dependent sugar dehydrogenase, partial [Myxococcota bacterium]